MTAQHALGQLRYDPLVPLLAADDAALAFTARRDLPGEDIPAGSLSESAGVRRIVARQQPDGRWKYPGGNPGTGGGAELPVTRPSASSGRSS